MNGLIESIDSDSWNDVYRPNMAIVKMSDSITFVIPRRYNVNSLTKHSSKISHLVNSLRKVSFSVYQGLKNESEFLNMAERVAAIVTRRLRFLKWLDTKMAQFVCKKIIVASELPVVIPQRFMLKIDEHLMNIMSKRIAELRTLARNRILNFLLLLRLKRTYDLSQKGIIKICSPKTDASTPVSIFGNFTTPPWVKRLVCQYSYLDNQFYYYYNHENSASDQNLEFYFVRGTRYMLNPAYKEVNCVVKNVGNMICNYIDPKFIIFRSNQGFKHLPLFHSPNECLSERITITRNLFLRLYDLKKSRGRINS